MAVIATQKNILAVDDEPRILEAVTGFLESKGYIVYTAQSGKQALEIFEQQDITLILLDLMLPDISGEEVCTRIRRKSRVPIIMLTAKSEESCQLEGLDVGADDYITKPFSLKVVAARIETVLRRSLDDLVPLSVRSSWGDGDLTVEFDRGMVYKQGLPVNLTATEFKILSALMKYPGKIFTREELLSLVLGEESSSLDRVIDNHIKNLRQKIEDDSRSPVYVLTMRGFGYKFGGE